MYLKHFGLTEKPFSITPDPDFLFFSPKHKGALAMLEYGVFEQSGITVITGEVGAGKTTLIRHLLRRIPYDEITVGLISNVHPSLGDLLQWVAIALELHVSLDDVSNVQIFRRLQDHLIQEYAEGRRVVLIIDEAQNMDRTNLEELRMLTNINADKDQLLQIVLVGQPQLFALLADESMAQIAQRVTAEYHLKPLDRSETGEYILNRLSIAGAGDRNLFTAQAMGVIYYFSGGIPRLVNTLCDHALVLAYAGNIKYVDFGTALDAVKEKRIGGVRRFCEPPKDAEHTRKVLMVSTGIDIDKAVND
ncbi:MAG: ExeA family protein [Pseudomonadales bacterium]